MSGFAKKRIGIMGGTFDPVHYGHLFIAECSRLRFGLERVLFVPAGQPVHKKRNDILEPVHRIEMTRLAIESNSFFELSTLETDRSGPTYTVDTMEDLNLKYHGSCDFYFITGADAILEILTWKEVTRVFELCRFIAVTRPGYSLEAINKVLRGLSPQQRERVYMYETSGILVSSTDIRQRVARGEPVKYLLPEKVAQYIKLNGLYRPSEVEVQGQ